MIRYKSLSKRLYGLFRELSEKRFQEVWVILVIVELWKQEQDQLTWTGAVIISA